MVYITQTSFFYRSFCTRKP